MTDRFGSISELLTSRPERQPATVRPIGPVGETPQPKPVQPRSTPKSRESDGGTRRVAFRLDPDLHARLVAHAKRTGTSHGNVVLDALEDAHTAGVLTDLVAAAKTPAATPDGMFARTAPRGAAAPSVPVEIQLRSQAVEQIDRLVAEHHADTRTQLMTAALRHHLR